MKNPLFFLLILFISCSTPEKINVDVPWFVKTRIYNDHIEAYNYRDSLDKYQEIDTNYVINKSNFFSYMANLNYVVHPEESSTTYKYIDAAIKADPTAFCKNFVSPINKFVQPVARPDRRYTMPFILDYNLNYFIGIRRQCINCCLDQLDSASMNVSDIALQISHISLLDQRYRNPQRQQNPEKQKALDRNNHILLDKLLISHTIPNDDTKIRSQLYAIILHSEDCGWTRKWLSRYMNSYGGYDKYKDHLRHFLRRSSCSDDYFKLFVGRELEKG